MTAIGQIQIHCSFAWHLFAILLHSHAFAADYGGCCAWGGFCGEKCGADGNGNPADCTKIALGEALCSDWCHQAEDNCENVCGGEFLEDEMPFENCAAGPPNISDLTRFTEKVPTTVPDGFSPPASSPVGRHGHLRVSGNQVVDAAGLPVQLTGMSLFWSQWRGDFWNEDVVNWLSSDWKVTVVRAPVAVEQQGFLTNPIAEKRKLVAVVDAAIKAGIYVIIDWHSHHAEESVEVAKVFFNEMARMYGAFPNVIWEPWNEPVHQEWAGVIKPYHEEIVPVIRSHSANIITLGTRSYSSMVDEASMNPVNGTNLAYTMHFYAASHRRQLRDRVTTAMDNGVVIFATAWGVCQATGSSSLDLWESCRWLEFFAEKNISWANWAINDNEWACSALKPGASSSGGWIPDDDLTESGVFVRAQNLGSDVCSPTHATTTTTYPPLEACKELTRAGEDCRTSRCCADEGHACYEKNQWWAQCRESCTPGLYPHDPPAFQTPWSCIQLGPETRTKTGAQVETTTATSRAVEGVDGKIAPGEACDSDDNCTSGACLSRLFCCNPAEPLSNCTSCDERGGCAACLPGYTMIEDSICSESENNITTRTAPPRDGATASHPQLGTASVGSFSVVLACFVAVLLLALAVAVWHRRRFRALLGGEGKQDLGGGGKQNLGGEGKQDLEQARPFEASATLASLNAHQCVPPEHWCVLPEQFFGDFMGLVHARWPSAAEDPSVYEVVEQVVKPVTREIGCGYALMLNPRGVPVKHFVTHAWAEGIMAFANALRQANVDGGLWICFLANPQTWRSDDLSHLLGSNPYMSPFYTALRESLDVVAVRNVRQDMYSRLWCVFELWAAVHMFHKPVFVVGEMPPRIEPTRTGFKASCYSNRDAKMLRSAIELHCTADKVNAYVASVLFARPGCWLSQSASVNMSFTDLSHASSSRAHELKGSDYGISLRTGIRDYV